MACVSIITPSFNSARFIKCAIDSVLNQTFNKWELIVVDGGSRDDTKTIISNYARSDSRIKLIENQNDKGPAHARSVGINNSVGSYIAFLDADDWWLPNKLQVQYSYMESEGLSFSYTRYRRVSEDGKRISCLVPMRREYNFRAMLHGRGIGTLTVMIKRDLLDEHIINKWKRAGGEECYWWLLLLKKGIVARLIDEDLARYRNVGGSLSKNILYTLNTIWKMYHNDLLLTSFQAKHAFCGYAIDSIVRRMRIFMSRDDAVNTNEDIMER